MKKRKTLYIKFIVTYLIFGVLAFITVATLTSEMTMNYMVKNEAASLYKEATLISNKYASYFYSNIFSSEDVEGQLDAIDTLTDSNIWIINSEGEVLYNSRNNNNQSSSKAIESFNPVSGNNYYTVGNFYGYFNEDTLSVYSAITSNFMIQGYVVIHIPMKNIYEQHKNVLYISYISLGIIFILSTLILVVFTDAVYIPLNQITTATEQYAEGNLKYTFDVNRTDEMGYLAAQLNYMAGKLSQTEDNQKKFIANVSHDFRSPLTSIKGYLVAMVDGTIPNEMHEKYLNIVLNETDRLTKLTNSLLTLNNLNISGMILETTDFDINEVIKNTVATFEGTCKEKKIKIKLVLSGPELLVKADMGKIQQVLYNLIDNAIKFSENGKTIKIETTIKNNKVFVSVKDEGIGIPKESLNHIFDRFYKSDLSRGKDKKGTGLGLSITKEIINAHKENINVISTEGVGSEFIFTLPESSLDEN
ncbi:MAG: HAMP domain-containing sensor histidine kinase [Lachnospiraceae bacterium]|nr:HAMP domain-containing sensor histidine kinase [Lachnospiraceae bacterium]